MKSLSLSEKTVSHKGMGPIHHCLNGAYVQGRNRVFPYNELITDCPWARVAVMGGAHMSSKTTAPPRPVLPFPARTVLDYLSLTDCNTMLPSLYDQNGGGGGGEGLGWELPASPLAMMDSSILGPGLCVSGQLCGSRETAGGGGCCCWRQE